MAIDVAARGSTELDGVPSLHLADLKSTER
jgi:hypothetical protein